MYHRVARQQNIRGDFTSIICTLFKTIICPDNIRIDGAMPF